MILRVAHVLNARARGGVPHVANALIRRADPALLSPHVFYLKPGDGPDLMEDIDIPQGTGAGGKTGAIIDLMNWLDANRIDILHTHSYRPNIYARLAGAVLRPSGLRIVAHYHNDYSDKWQEPAILGVERRLAGITDAAIAVSDAVARHVAEKVPEYAAIDVIENGIDRVRLAGDRQAARADLGLEPRQLTVGLVGRVCRQKGVDTFVEAAVRLAPAHPAVRFLIVGDVEDKALAADLGRRIAGAGLDRAIQFAGYREDVGAVYAALDVLAAPSRWEGFGLVLAEAMAVGLPVIAAHVGGIPAVVGNAARLVPPDDVAALAAEIAALLADPSERTRLAQAGEAEARRFDWDNTAERVHAVYRRITESA